MSAVRSVYEIEAAWVRVEPHLAGFDRGDNIALAWLSETGKIEAWRLSARVRRWFERRDIKTLLRGEVIHLCTAEEQSEAGKAHSTRAIKQHARALKTYKGTPRDALSPGKVAEVDRLQFRELAYLTEAEGYRKQDKVVTGSPVPNPRPRLVSDSK